MNPQAAQTYLRTKVLTATPEQLQMMLYDGALRFAEQARAALDKQDYETNFQMISKVQKIIAELSSSLKHDLAPELCGKLAALYNFAYRKLIEASTRRDPAALDEALDVLRYQRQTWAMLLDQLGKQKAGNAARNLDLPAPSARMETTISMKA